MNQQSPLIPLSKTHKFSSQKVGSKARALGQLIQNGIKVPSGFVITSDIDLVDKSIAENIYKLFDELGSEYVAVRSSASFEDSNNYSWAGQLNSYIFVNRKTLLQKIIECRNSIDTDRVKIYSSQYKSNLSNYVSVIVQVMKNSDISGVTFTANPINKSNDEYMIESVYGLGELLVQGKVSPENILVSSKNGKILKRNRSFQKEELTFTSNRLTLKKITSSRLNEHILNDKQINSLFLLSKKVHMIFNCPQDIEWLIYENEIFIVQSRPITTI